MAGAGAPEGFAERSLRSRSSVVSAIAIVGMGAFVIGDAAVRGSADVVLSLAPAVLVLVWIYWAVVGRPRIAFGSRGATVVNPLRVTTVPWAAVADVRTRYQLAFQLVDGRLVRCWGGPTAHRPARGREPRAPVPPGAAARATGDPIDEIVEVWKAASAQQRAVEELVSRWDLPPVAAGIAVLVVAVALLLVR